MWSKLGHYQEGILAKKKKGGGTDEVQGKEFPFKQVRQHIAYIISVYSPWEGSLSHIWHLGWLGNAVSDLVTNWQGRRGKQMTCSLL